MEQDYIEDGVRERLIISGINELSEHGLSDFSLRRTALKAQVSCAAPYRHFKDKDELIREIVGYITSKWNLLCCEIASAFLDDPHRLVIEVAVATLRFWLGNPNFRSVLSLDVNTDTDFDSYLISTIRTYTENIGSPEHADELSYLVRSQIYGTVMLVTMGKLIDTDQTVSRFRKSLELILP